MVMMKDTQKVLIEDFHMINRKGEDYKDELDEAEEALEEALANFTKAVANASYAQGVEDTIEDANQS